MSEEPVAEASQRRLGQNASVFIALGIALILIMLLSWALNIRASAMQREAFGRGVDGLSPMLVQPVLQTKTIRSQNPMALLDNTLREIVQSGKYESMVVTDPQGTVVSTTDTTLVGQTLRPLADAKGPATVRDGPNGLEATAAVVQGGQKIGAFRIVYRP